MPALSSAEIYGSDISDRKQTELALGAAKERFQRIAASAYDAIIEVDDGGNITFWNDAAERLFGYSSTEVIGSSLHPLITPREQLEAAERGFADFRHTGEGSILGRVREVEALRRNGTVFPVELSVSALWLGEAWHAVGVVRDIGERKRAEGALRDSELALRESMDILARVNEQRRELLARLVDAQENERAAIAEDLHDDSIQVMTAVGIRLASLLRSGSEEERTETLRKLEETVSAAIARLRRLVFELRPRVLDEEGLASAIRAYLALLGPEVEFVSDVDNRLASEPSPQARVILYRITQEALANVRKHARATHVTVTIEPQDDGSIVRVVDDGVGFDPASVASHGRGHLGLAAMRERAEMAGGWCKVKSAPGDGTTVEFWVPRGV